jgi:hypothetical protein
MPGPRQRSIQASHFRKMLNDAARRDDGDDHAMPPSALNEACEQAESSGIDVAHAGQIERHVRFPGPIHMRCPEVLVCTLAENQPAACPDDKALCLAERGQ